MPNDEFPNDEFPNDEFPNGGAPVGDGTSGDTPSAEQPAGQRQLAYADTVFEEPDLPAEPRQRASALKTAGLVSVRLVTGIVMIGVVGATLVAASVIPFPTVHRAAPSTVVTPVPTAAQLVCPGGLLRLASASGKGATKASTLGAADVSAAASNGSVHSSAFAESDASTGGSAEAPQLLTTPPATGSTQPTLVSGAQAQTISTTEFFGLAAAVCSAPSGDSWLVGGATTVGRTSLVLLANPSAVAADVSLQVYGENGQVASPGDNGIVVPPHGQRVVALAGIAPSLASPVIHVHSRGGQVVANLEQTTTRGLTPGGVDILGSVSAEAKTIVIPGVVVSSTNAVQDKLGQSGYDDLQTTLRIYLPGLKASEAEVSILSEDGKPTGKALGTDLDPGKVTDLPLDELSDGSYTVVVSSPRPIVGSVRVSTAGSAAVATQTDFAWLTSAPLLSRDALVTAANGMTPVLHLENPTKSSEHVVIAALGGGTVTATVAPSGATSVPLSAGTTYRLSAFSGLYAAVSGVTDGGVTGYVVEPTQEGSTPIRVFG